MKKYLFNILMIIIFSAFFTNMGEVYFYTWHRPTHPQPELNQTSLVLADYNKTIYLSKKIYMFYMLII
jgi:hypothetical protein